MNNLHPIAQSVQSQGRGEDTQLVHMTPGEVQGLQALAKAHGGSLTINPETGLVEAGFLKSILPTIAGVGLSMMGVPPPLAAGIVGLGTTALSGGDLGKGLMAGIGAYGGAGLGQSLGLGAAASVSGAPAVNASVQAANTGLATQGASGLGTSAAQSASANNFLTQSGMTGLPQASLAPQGLGAIPQTVTPMATSAMSKLATPGFYGDNALNIGAAISPMLFQEPKTQSAPVDNEQYQYTYNPGKTSREDLDAQRLANPDGELRYFTPSYQGPNKVRVAEGGILGLAEGGALETIKAVDGTPYGAAFPFFAGSAFNSDTDPANEGNDFKYTFDPVTQRYTKKPGVAPTAPTAPTAPIAAVTPIGIDASGGYESTMSAPNSNYSGPGLMSMALGNFGQSPAPVDSSQQTFSAAAAAQAQQAANINSSPDVGVGGPSGGGGGNGYNAGDGGYGSGTVGYDAGDMGHGDAGGGGFSGADADGGFGPSSPGGMAAGGLMGLAAGGTASSDSQDASRDANRLMVDLRNKMFGSSIEASNLKAFAQAAGSNDPNIRENAAAAMMGMPMPEQPVVMAPQMETAYDPGTQMYYEKERNAASGGLMGLAAGGMAKGGFVVPADVVSALGNGSTDAGLRSLKARFGAVKHIKGKGDGLSDSINTSIDGKQPARVADGEAYIDPKTVAIIGKGDPKKGAQKLYAMMDKIRGQAHGKTTQQRKVDPRKVV